MDSPAEFLAAARNAFEANKRLADRAVEQLADDRLHVALDGDTNSIAVILPAYRPFSFFPVTFPFTKSTVIDFSPSDQDL
jgi:Protein of unknown function (DUF1572)